MQWRPKLPEVALALVVMILYVTALFTPVVRKGLSAGPFDLATIYGLSCLLTGWMDYPIGWLANPFLFIGVVLLVCGIRSGAVVCGALAAGCVVQWSVPWHRDGLWGMLEVGYRLWVSSVAVLLLGSLCLWIVRGFLACRSGVRRGETLTSRSSA